MRLDRLMGEPLHLQLRRIVEDRIVSGEWKPGEVMPSERELCNSFGVSSITARRALRDLVAAGVIIRRPGIGSFVASRERSSRIVLLIFGFSEDARSGGAGFFGDLVGGIAETAWMHDSVFTMVRVMDETHVASHVRSVLAEEMFDGILLRCHGDLPEEAIDLLEAAHLPYVSIKRRLIGRDVNCVVMDDERSGYDATTHLLELGHERVAFIGPSRLLIARDRERGYRRALIDHGIEPRVDWIRKTDDFNARSGRSATEALLALPAEARPTAVFVAADLTAVGLYEASRTAGLRIPDDLAVVGHDDVAFAAHLTPSLTTIHTPYDEFGRRSTELLLDLIAHPDPEPRSIELGHRLIVRQSSGARRTVLAVGAPVAMRLNSGRSTDG
jgi:DNA-binding LacI/PurR family transcriptional regulator